TACQQIAAEELDVPFASLKLVTADTARTANEGYTSGSNSMKDSGTAVQNAAAQVRALLIAEAARRLELPFENLRCENGAVVAAKEYQAVKAMWALSAAAKWRETAKLPKQDNLPDVLTSLPSRDETIFQRNNPFAAGARTFEATFTRPYQAHGSIGPSCAV